MKKKFYYVVYNHDNNPYLGQIKAKCLDDALFQVKKMFDKYQVRVNAIHLFTRCSKIPTGYTYKF